MPAPSIEGTSGLFSGREKLFSGREKKDGES
jgi:hypothetical protein